MISRRIIRAKVLQVLYAHFKGEKDLAQSEKELFFNIEKTVDLFFYMILLISELTNYAEKMIMINRNKKLPNHDDLHPNTRFIDNKVVKQLKENQQFNDFIDKKKLSWVNHQDLIKSLFNDLLKSTWYKDYMNAPQNAYQEDKTFLINIFRDVIISSDQLYSVLEEQSIYWNDDIEFVASIIINIIKSLKPGQGPGFLLYNDTDEEKKDDMDYAKHLSRKTVLNYSSHRALIGKHADNWDVERIAFMDILIMAMAITELLEFRSIPVNVTFYEYIELAKLYSTENSFVFINGVLDRIVAELKQEKRIKKQGRGLIEDKK